MIQAQNTTGITYPKGAANTSPNFEVKEESGYPRRSDSQIIFLGKDPHTLSLSIKAWYSVNYYREVELYKPQWKRKTINTALECNAYASICRIGFNRWAVMKSGKHTCSLRIMGTVVNFNSHLDRPRLLVICRVVQVPPASIFVITPSHTRTRMSNPKFAIWNDVHMTSTGNNHQPPLEMHRSPEDWFLQKQSREHHLPRTGGRRIQIILEAIKTN